MTADPTDTRPQHNSGCDMEDRPNLEVDPLPLPGMAGESTCDKKERSDSDDCMTRASLPTGPHVPVEAEVLVVCDSNVGRVSRELHNFVGENNNWSSSII